ncbi:MAG: NUDIX domain-containing protein [Anaerolineaceae bacterium]|nr:NUDIX domain-containing protein [Anaerolineaceae bacterium]
MRECTLNDQEGWFRLRGTGIIIENGHVLMAHNEKEPYYYSVGGGVLQNESTTQAVMREVFEETGIHYEIERLAFILENFFIMPIRGEEKKCHEIAFYYLMKPRGSMEIHAESKTMDGAKEEMVWLPLDQLADKHLYPLFFKKYLNSMPEGIIHIVEREY